MQVHGGPFEFDLDGREQTVWLEASYNPISDSHDRLYKVVKFATVVTDQVNRELAVVQAADVAYSTSRHTDAAANQTNLLALNAAIEAARAVHGVAHAGNHIRRTSPIATWCEASPIDGGPACSCEPLFRPDVSGIAD